MALTKLTIETAPRDRQELVEKGRFNLRALATELGMLQTEDTKSAFMSQSTEEQAKQVLEALQAYDKQGNGGKTSRTKRTPEKHPDYGKQPAAAAATAPADAPADTSRLEALLSEVRESQQQLAALGEKVVAGLERLEKIAGASTSLSLLFSEEVLKSGRDEVLGAALEDAAAVVDTIVGKATTKKR